MPPVVIDLRKANDDRDVVHRAVQALAEGGLVAFPTETVYGLGASACNADAVQRLADVKGRSASAPFALAIKSADEASDYFPSMDPLAKRLARRCWPGPVTLVLEETPGEGLAKQLPESARRFICPNGTIGLRVAASSSLSAVLRMLAGPIALSSANRSGETDATTADEVVESLGNDVALVLDDGPCRYGQPSSVVKVSNGKVEVLREGVVAKSTLDRLSKFLVVLVCTGNTCRSPMAEMLMKSELAKALGCGLESLEDSGVMVVSAGIAASLGSPPSREAIEVMREHGLSLGDHEARPLTDQLVKHADLILTMTGGHQHAIFDGWPESAGRTRRLLPDETDVADPIGRSIEVYRDCAAQIKQGVAHHAANLKVAIQDC